MLAFHDNGSWLQWTGQRRPRDGEGIYQLPRKAEAVFDDEDLALYGLHSVTPA